jgi:hypothetical protein
LFDYLVGAHTVASAVRTKPCPDEELKTWPVGKAVGNVKTQGRSWRCQV